MGRNCVKYLFDMEPAVLSLGAKRQTQTRELTHNVSRRLPLMASKNESIESIRLLPIRMEALIILPPTGWVHFQIIQVAATQNYISRIPAECRRLLLEFPSWQHFYYLTSSR